MFLKSRKKIVLSVMAVLLLFLALTLATIYGSSYLSLKKQNEDMLDRYVDMFSLDALPGQAPPGPPLEPGEDGHEPSGEALYDLSSFYSVAMADDGKVLATDTGNNGLYRESEIKAWADRVLEDKKTSGMMGHMLFQVDRREGYTLVAFMDMALTDNNMGTLLFHILIAGMIAILFFFGISVILARRIIGPLEENDRRQKQFISDAGHELKTPVSVISANVELLSKQIGENQWLSNISYENQRMGNLVKDLLDLSRAENSTMDSEEIDFSRLTEQEVLPFESIAYEHGLLIRSQIDKGIFIHGNARQLGQLVSILMDNAISHSSRGGELTVILEKKCRQVHLQVTNPGEEIPEELLDRLFDRFYRMDEARAGQDGHFGLGLSIAKAITEAHGGEITVKCQAGNVICLVVLPGQL